MRVNLASAEPFTLTIAGGLVRLIKEEMLDRLIFTGTAFTALCDLRCCRGGYPWRWWLSLEIDADPIRGPAGNPTTEKVSIFSPEGTIKK